MVDQFANEYGWTDAYVFSRTYFQLQVYGKELARRRSRDRQLAANTIRMAQHADRPGFDRFLKSLEVADAEKREAPVGALPDGFQHSQEW